MKLKLSKIFKLFITVFIGLSVLLGISFVYGEKTDNQTQENTIKIKSKTIEFEDAKKKNAFKNSIIKETNYRLLIKSDESVEEISNLFSNYDEKVEVKKLGNGTYRIKIKKDSEFGQALSGINNDEIPEMMFEKYEVIQPEIFQIDTLEENIEYITGENLENMWGMQAIHADKYQKDISVLEKVKVGIIDTGILTSHEDLNDNIIDLGYDFINDDNIPDDENGHGTSVAGIIGGEVNGGGVFGVNSNAELIGLKMFDANGYGSTYDIVDAINYAIENDINILNMSFGLVGDPTGHIVCDSITQARENGVLSVVAAGNYDIDISNTVPAGCSDVIVVGSVDENLEQSSFSNYGEGVIFAPGENIYSSNNDGGYKSNNGTSFSAPFVAGMASIAYVYSEDKDLNIIETNIKNSISELGIVDMDSFMGNYTGDDSGGGEEIIPDSGESGVEGDIEDEEGGTEEDNEETGDVTLPDDENSEEDGGGDSEVPEDGEGSEEDIGGGETTLPDDGSSEEDGTDEQEKKKEKKEKLKDNEGNNGTKKEKKNEYLMPDSGIYSMHMKFDITKVIIGENGEIILFDGMNWLDNSNWKLSMDKDFKKLFVDIVTEAGTNYSYKANIEDFWDYRSKKYHSIVINWTIEGKLELFINTKKHTKKIESLSISDTKIYEEKSLYQSFQEDIRFYNRKLTIGEIHKIYLFVIGKGNKQEAEQDYGIGEINRKDQFYRIKKDKKEEKIKDEDSSSLSGTLLEYIEQDPGTIINGLPDNYSIDTSSKSIIASLPTGNLVGYWSFDNCSTVDQSGNNNNGISYNSPTCVAGKEGEAMQLGGYYDRDYIKANNSSSLTFTDNFTVNLWFNVKGIDGMTGRGTYSEYGSQTLFSKAGDRNGLTVKMGRSSTTGLFYPRISNGRCCTSDSRSLYTTSGYGLSMNEWHMLSVTSGNGFVRYYLDGILQNEMTTSEFNVNPSMATQPVQMGIDQSATRYPFDGILDEVKIYNTDLSRSEIIETYGSNPLSFNLEYNIEHKFEEIGGLSISSNSMDVLFEEDEYFYYINSDDGNKIYKIKKDGSENSGAGERISNSNCSRLEFEEGDYIYYYNIDDNYRLYRIKKDGSENLGAGIKVFNEGWYLFEEGDYIYYTNYNDGYKFYRIKKDGSENFGAGTKISDVQGYNGYLEGDYIYYNNVNDDYKIYKVKKDGSENFGAGTKLSNNKGRIIFNELDYIYYRNVNDGEKIYRVKKDGSDNAGLGTKVSDYQLGFTFEEGDYIYHTNYDDGYLFYRLRKDGTESTGLGTKISVDRGGFDFEEGDYIYYSNYNDGYKLYRVKKDGTENAGSGTKISTNRGYIEFLEGDYIYYTNSEDQSILYKIKKDGSENSGPGIKISTTHGYFKFEEGDYIYYGITSDSEKIYRIKKDGTENFGAGTKLGDLNGDILYIENKYFEEGDYIYFFTSNDSTVYKVKKNGTEINLSFNDSLYDSDEIILNYNIDEAYLGIDATLYNNSDYKFYLANQNQKTTLFEEGEMGVNFMMDIIDIMDCSYINGDSSYLLSQINIGDYITLEVGGSSEDFEVLDVMDWGCGGNIRVNGMVDQYWGASISKSNSNFTEVPESTLVGTEELDFNNFFTEFSPTNNLYFKVELEGDPEVRHLTPTVHTVRISDEPTTGNTIIINAEVNYPTYPGALTGSDSTISTITQENFAMIADNLDIQNVGDGVNLSNGEYRYSNNFFHIPGVGLDYNFNLSYGNQVSYTGAVGINWTHNYNLFLQEKENNIVTFYDGNLDMYDFDLSLSGYNQALQATLTSGTNYAIIFDNGYVYNFGLNLKIESIEDKFGNDLTFSYNADNELDIVTDTLGRDITYNYVDGNLDNIEDWHYNGVKLYYNGDDLAIVERYMEDEYFSLLSLTADTRTTTFEYFDNHNLKSITDAENQKYLQNVYDTNNMITNQTYGTDSMGWNYVLTGTMVDNVIVTNLVGTVTNYDMNEDGNIISRDVTNTENGTISSYYSYNTNKRIDQHKLPEGNGMVYLYNAANIIESAMWDKDNINITTTPTSCLTGNISCIATKYQYGAYNLISQVINPEGKETDYTITGKVITGKTIQDVMDIDGNTVDIVTYYSYYPTGLLDTVSNPEGTITDYDYVNGQLRKITTNSIIENQYDYDDYGYLRKTIDGEYNSTNYTVSEWGETLTIQTPEGDKTRYTYDNNSNLETVEVYSGSNYILLKDIDYDILDQAVVMTSYRTDSDILGTVYTYDGNGNLKTEKTGANATISYDYNEFDSVKKESALTSETIYSYDKNNNLEKVTDPEGNILDYVYDSFDRAEQVTKGNLLVKAIYDKLGNIEDTKAYSGSTSGELLAHSINDYNKVGLLNSATQKADLPENDRLIEYKYNKVGQPKEITDPRNNKILYNYDNYGRLDTLEVNDTDQIIKKYTYDNRHLPTVESIKTYNNSILITGASIDTTYTYYDDGKLKTSKLGSNNAKTYYYNDLSQMIEVVDEEGKHTQINYDYWDNAEKTTIFSGSTSISTIYKYNDYGNLITMIDANNNATHYHYDTLNRLEREKHPLKDINDINEIRLQDIYTYDKNNNIKTITDGKENLITYYYNNFSLVYEKTIARNGGTIGVNKETFEYDTLGRLTTGQNFEGTTNISTIGFTYNLLGDLETETNNSKTITYGYDDNGSRNSISLPNSHDIIYGYDNLSRVNQVNSSIGIRSHSYYKGMLLERENRGNARNQLYEHDDLLRIKFIMQDNEVDPILVDGGAGTSAFIASTLEIVRSYTYYDAGNIESDGVRSYVYDHDYRLKSSEYSEDVVLDNIRLMAKEEYNIDNLGNRKQKDAYYDFYSGTGATQSLQILATGTEKSSYGYNINGLNQITKVIDSSKTAALEYDNNGNLEIYDDNEDDSDNIDYNNKYHYDYKNKLKKVTDKNDNIIVTFEYDVVGRRYEKVNPVTGETKKYTYTLHDILQEEIVENSQLIQTKREVYGGRGMDDLLGYELESFNFQAKCTTFLNYLVKIRSIQG